MAELEPGRPFELSCALPFPKGARKALGERRWDSEDKDVHFFIVLVDKSFPLLFVNHMGSCGEEIFKPTIRCLCTIASVSAVWGQHLGLQKP